MRKNGVNRKIRPIEGGVCAVAGFSASAISCGVRTDGGFDFALVAPQRRCPVGYVPLSKENPSLAAVNRKHLKSGYAQALFFNSGIANIFQEEGEKYTETLSREVDRVTRFSAGETLYFSVGEVGKKFPCKTFGDKIKELICQMGNTEEDSVRVVRALMREGGVAKQLSFSFDIGDFPCRMGAICKGGADGTLIILTTDARITPQMLQRALEAETREVLDGLTLGYPHTPNDCACILANGGAGNSLIDCADSEYKKFTFALRAVLTEVCKVLAGNGKGALECSVLGVKSKQAARFIAKALASSDVLRTAFLRKELDLEALLYTLAAAEDALDVEKLSVTLCGGEKNITVFEMGKKLPYSKESMREIFSELEVKVEVSMRQGNYAATAFGQSVVF